MDPLLEDSISDHISLKWKQPGVVIFRDAPAEGDFDGLLLIGDCRASDSTGAPITESVGVEDAEGAEFSMDDVLFQIDAKLGRLTNSNMVKESTRSYLTRDGTFSRRELFTGARKGYRRYSNLPFFNESCEAQHGCAKCLEACPAKALRLEGGSVAVIEADCTTCGRCAAVCPVGAVQMPEFPEAALLGLLDEVDEVAAPRKTLVLTCDSGAVKRSPWMLVEQMSSIGMLGPRQIAAAAAASLGGVAVVCPDGKCAGKESAKAAVGAISRAIAAGPDPPFVVFIEGEDEIKRLTGLHQSSKARSGRSFRSGDRWKDYIGDLAALVPPDASTSGLLLSGLKVDESCTLCSACAKSCPHGSLRLDERHLHFSASTCTGCGRCVAICPEHSMTVSEAIASFSQVMKSEAIYEDDLVSCVRCGSPLGSAKFVSKVTGLLGPDARLLNYCPACKKQLVVESLFGGRKNA